MLKPKVARYFSTVPSTSTELLGDLARHPHLQEGTVYLTVDQTAGRGQDSNPWHASPGANLTLSILLRPVHLSVERLFALNEAVSLAVARCVRDFLPPHIARQVRVKWPNDVYVGDRKIAGILIQNGLRGSQLLYSVVGIGLNVNEAAFPPELVNKATSLRLLTREELPLEDVCELLFANLGDTYRLTQLPKLTELRELYGQQLYRLGTVSDFVRSCDGSRFAATIVGVSVEGRLRLAYGGGREELFDMRSIRMVPVGG